MTIEAAQAYVAHKIASPNRSSNKKPPTSVRNIALVEVNCAPGAEKNESPPIFYEIGDTRNSEQIKLAGDDGFSECKIC